MKPNLLKEQEVFFSELLERTRKKQIEYKGTVNPFHNFEEAAKLSFTNNREKAAWEFCVKHLVSLKDMLEPNSNLSIDLIDEKIGDIVVYMTIIRSMLINRMSNIQEEKLCLIF